MPIYEFQCPKCGNKIETIVQNAEVKCQCGEKMKRIISPPALIQIK